MINKEIIKKAEEIKNGLIKNGRPTMFDDYTEPTYIKKESMENLEERFIKSASLVNEDVKEVVEKQLQKVRRKN